MESPECRALRRGSSLLKNGINPDDIVSLLSDKKLLTPEERNQANASHLTPSKRMEEVHTALERRVSVTSEAFHTFLDILKCVTALGPVAEKLYKFFLEERGTARTAVDTTASPITSAAPAVGATGSSTLVLPSPLPRHMVASQSSHRHAQPSSDVGSSGPTSSVSSFQNTTGDLPSGSTDTYARDETPVQTSQQDRTKSEMFYPRPPKQLSKGFMAFAPYVRSEAMSSGVTPSNSQQLEDLMLKMDDQCEQLEIANKNVARLEKYKAALLKQRKKEREEYDGLLNDERSAMVADLVMEIKRMELEHKEQMEQEQQKCRAALEQSKALKEENETLKSEKEAALQRAAAVEKCPHLKEQRTRVRRLSEEHYDTTLQLDYAFQSVLDKEGVDEEFKKKVSELKKEVEERKNSTWP